MNKEICFPDKKIAVVGLGYVGLPLAVAFAKHFPVIGFDLNEAKIDLYKRGIDPTEEVGDEAVKESSIFFTSDPSFIKEAKYVIVAVPTPVNADTTPDLKPVEGASQIVGENLGKGAIVVFESTVWPGVTEDICLPIIEKASGLLGGQDFKIGYSPERINPGDKIHRLSNIVKIVSGMDEETLEEIATLYGTIIEAGVHKASSMKVAEAAKLIENSQRDINIAFMNECAIVFNKMGIRTKDVVDAMNTKWNALGFTPGLVGGHCIGVDPYYFIYKAELLGYQSHIIMAGRTMNDGMSRFVVENTIKQMILAHKDVSRANVYVMGITFKENCPDVRNSKVADIVKYLKEYNINVNVVDPWAEAEEVEREYGVRLVDMKEIHDADCLILAVGHEQFRKLSPANLQSMCKAGEKNVLVDVKSILNPQDFDANKTAYWSL